MTVHDEFDQALDDALAEYREAEPLAGLEDRVLQRLRLQTARRWKAWWRWSSIGAAAVALVIAALIGLGDRTRQDVGDPVVVQRQVPSVEAQPAHEYPASKRTPVAKATSRKSPVLVAVQLSREPVPMPERFPSPAPLKPEERMLLALATTHTEILMSKTGDDKEIVIDPINIKPLVDETGAYQGEN
jgi:hypothetical protein